MATNQNGRNHGQTTRDERASTEQYGQGQSGYGAGRFGEDRSLDMENRNQGYGGRFQEQQGNTDDRFSGRGGSPYSQDRGMDRGMDTPRGTGFSGGDRGGHQGFGGGDRNQGYNDDRGFGGAENRGYNSGYNQGGGGYGGNDRGSGGSRYQGDRGFNGDRYGNDQRFAPDRTSGNWDMDRQTNDRGGFRNSESFSSQGGGQGGYGTHLGQGRQGGFGQHGSTQSGFGQELRGPQGPHRGKGPQGWQRSDERIRELVCETLADDEHIDATHIDITVTNGDVTLTGTVPDRQTKRLVEDVVERVSGVKDITNQLKFGDRGPSTNGSKHRA